jgi:chemotaxis protein MotB
MAKDENTGEQPIIIKKIVKGGGGHHGGAWKVAYADFVTAMMAFFIVMWIISASEETKQQVSNYFDNPGAFSFVNGKLAVPIDLGLKNVPGKLDGERHGDGSGKNQVLDPTDQNRDDFHAIKQAIREKAIEDSILAAQKLQETAKEIKDYISNLKEERQDLKEVLNSIVISLSDEGLRIDLIETDDNYFFKVGSADIRGEVRIILKELAFEIGQLPNYVTLEGHTDARGFGKTASYTNWELSADRANAARGYMAQHGLWDGQIRKVIGYADSFLRIPENPFDNRNRRISILIQNLKVSELEIKEEDLY